MNGVMRSICKIPGRKKNVLNQVRSVNSMAALLGLYMNIKSALQNTLYFIPVIRIIHHARELCKLNREYHE